MRMTRAIAPKVRKLEKKVKMLWKLADNVTGKFTSRTSAYDIRTNLENKVDWTTFTTGAGSQIEVALEELTYYDPATPASFKTAAFGNGLQEKEVMGLGHTMKLEVKANYEIPASVEIWLCTVKTDTSTDPFNSFVAGLSNSSSATITSPQVYPHDSKVLTDLWHIKRVVKRILLPGDSVVYSHTSEPYTYDPSLFDTQVSAFQKRFKSIGFLLRLTGLLGHDSTITTQQGLTQARVDIQLNRTYKFKYAAGTDTTSQFIVDGEDVASNDIVSCNLRTADIQLLKQGP